MNSLFIRVFMALSYIYCNPKLMQRNEEERDEKISNKAFVIPKSKLCSEKMKIYSLVFKTKSYFKPRHTLPTAGWK